MPASGEAVCAALETDVQDVLVDESLYSKLRWHKLHDYELALVDGTVAAQPAQTQLKHGSAAVAPTCALISTEVSVVACRSM